MANATLPRTARSPAVKPERRRSRLLWIALFLPVTAAGIYGGLRTFSVDPSQPPSAEPRSLPPRVSALGRLAPDGEVVSVAPPTPTGTLAGARVEELLVDVSDE